MEVQSQTNKLKERLTCSVCARLYTNPKELPCSHVLCFDCLKTCERSGENANEIQVNTWCPLCQTEVAVPGIGSLEALPDCFYVKTLLNLLAFKESRVSSVPCANCEETSEEAWFCFHCNKIWCEDCLKAHNALKENKQHRVLHLKDFQEKNFEDVLKPLATPVYHPTVLAEQSEHCNEEISATEELNYISSGLETAKQSSSAISKYIRRLEETSRLIDYRSKINKEQITKSVQSLVSSLRVKEREALDKVDKDTRQAQEELQRQICDLRNKMSNSEEIISSTEWLVQCGTREELLQSKAVIDEPFNGLHDLQDPKHEPALATDWKTVTVFVENKHIFESLQESGIGHISTQRTTTEAKQCIVKWSKTTTTTAGLEAHIEVITRNAEAEQCYCPGDYFTVQLISVQGRNTAIETKINDKQNGSFVISFIPTQAGQHLPTIQINGETVRGFPPVQIRERSYAIVGCIAMNKVNNSVLREPWGIATNSWNHIMVTDMYNHCIVVFNEEGKFWGSFGQNFLRRPVGICIDENNRIYVANRGNNKITLFGPKGEYITAIHNGDSLKEPRGISLDAQGNLIICDTGNGCLQVMSPNGSILRTIGKGGLRKPFGCLLHEDKVFVSDRDFHLVKVYNYHDGRFLYEFGRHGTLDVVLNAPSGIAMDKTGHILVGCGEAENKPHRVHVYTLDGKLVTMFGDNSSGEKLGQFNMPCSMTILQNGRIVVCDVKNSRLQIYQ